MKKYLEEIKENLKSKMNDISIDFSADYSITNSDYICDCFTDYADNRVDIYNYDLLNWAKDNYEYVEEAIDEFGVSKDNKGRADFIKTIMSGQYLYYDRELYEDEKEIYQLLAINYLLEHEQEIEVKLTNEKIDELLDEIDTLIDNNDYLEDILEIVNRYIKKDEEDN